MPRTPTLFFLFLPLLLSPPSMADTTTSDATYTFFLQCINSHTNFSSSANLLLSQSNSHFPSALSSTLRNLRFSSAAAPLLILTPLLPSHVSAAVLCARRHALQIKIRSGGHDFEGLSYTSDRPNFILLDLSNFRRVAVDLPTSTARVGAGATVGELYFAIWSKSLVLALPAGLCPTVGVGGHLTGGGYGTLIRKHGLSIDHILDAEMVLSDGRILTRKTMGEDLFWAIRGGGGSSFGVILSYTVGLVAVPAAVTVFKVEKMVDEEVTEMVYKWQVVMKEVDENLFMRLLLQPTGKAAVKTVKVTFLGLYLGPTYRLMETMKREFPELGLQSMDCKEMSWAESVLSWYNYPVGTPVDVLASRSYRPMYTKRKSDYVRDPIPKAGLNNLWRKLAELREVGMVLNAYGGRMSEVPADATAFPHRRGNLYKIQYSVSWKVGGAAAEARYVGMARELYEFMAAYVSRNPRAAFLNYRDLDIGVSRNGTYEEGRVYGEKYFLGNFERLVRVKTAVDPDNFFQNEQSIPVMKR